MKLLPMVTFSWTACSKVPSLGSPTKAMSQVKEIVVEKKNGIVFLIIKITEGIFQLGFYYPFLLKIKPNFRNINVIFGRPNNNHSFDKKILQMADILTYVN